MSRGLVLNLLIHPLAAALVALVVLGHTSHQMVAIWLLGVWTVAAVRAVYWHRYRHDNRSRLSSESATTRRAALLTAIAVISNFLWGIGPLFIWPNSATGPQVLLLVTIAAAISLEMMTLASFMLAVIISLTASLLALLVAMNSHGMFTPAFVGALLLYASVIAIGTFHTNRLLFESLRLRFELAGASTAAEAASKAKSDFIANMSHELRTPLNAIIGFSEMIKDQIFGRDASARYVEYASHIHRSGLHLLEIINDILDLSKIEAGQFELKDEKVELAEIVKSALVLITDRADEAGVAVETSLPNPSPAIRGDERAIKQALLNLLSNAVKFTPVGGSVNISVRSDIAGGLFLIVKDSGVGMSPADIPKAMRPFGQLGNVHTRTRSGTGLGLPIVRSLVEMHEGKLNLISQLGVGTSAEIYFPPRRVLNP